MDTSKPTAGIVMDGAHPGARVDCLSVVVPPTGGWQAATVVAATAATKSIGVGGEGGTSGGNTNKEDVLGASWTAFASEPVPVTRYQWGLGTRCGVADVHGFRWLATDSVEPSAAGGVAVYTATANASIVMEWMQETMGADVAPSGSDGSAATRQVPTQAPAASAFVVATVRGYNAFGAYTESCSDGVRVLVTRCHLGDNGAGGAMEQFMCASARDFECVAM